MPLPGPFATDFPSADNQHCSTRICFAKGFRSNVRVAACRFHLLPQVVAFRPVCILFAAGSLRQKGASISANKAHSRVPSPAAALCRSRPLRTHSCAFLYCPRTWAGDGNIFVFTTPPLSAVPVFVCSNRIFFFTAPPSGKHPDIPCTKGCRSGVDHDTCRLRFLHAENRFGQAPKLRRPQAKIACGLRYSDTVRARTDRHTVIISFSLSANASSICLLNRSVSFCASASPSLAISSGMPFF